MSVTEQNAQQRHDRFLLAELAVAGRDGLHPIRVRNLSAGGMMGEGDVAVDRGSQLSIAFPNLGEVTGQVAWVQGDRFGVAFDDQINPDEVFGSDRGRLELSDPSEGGANTERRGDSRLS